MNLIHNRICSSGWWSHRVEHELLPWGLEGVSLGDTVLEVGPGLGATTRVLARSPIRLRVAEIEESYCRRLRAELGPNVEVEQADATALPYADGAFSAVVCFTMLHHIPTDAQQDHAFAEFVRVLRPGGVFAGTDSVGTGPLFKLIHIGDTLNLLDADRLPQRLAEAGFAGAQVERGGRSIRFRAYRPE